MISKNKKAAPRKLAASKSKKVHDYSTTLQAQRARILEHLQQFHSLSTLEAREVLDILHPAGRIKELRNRGYNIKTHMEVVSTLKAKHRIGRYYLSGMEAITND